MTLPASADISIGNTAGTGRSINTELGRSDAAFAHLDDPGFRSLAQQLIPGSPIQMSNFYSRTNLGDLINVYSEYTNNVMYITTNYKTVPTSFKSYIKYSGNAEYLYNSGTYTGTDNNCIVWSGSPSPTNLEYIRVEFYFSDNTVIQTNNMTFPRSLDTFLAIYGTIYNDASYPTTTGLQSIDGFTMSFQGNGFWNINFYVSNFQISSGRFGAAVIWWNSGSVEYFYLPVGSLINNWVAFSSKLITTGTAGMSSYIYNVTLIDQGAPALNNGSTYYARTIFPQQGRAAITYTPPSTYYPGQVATISLIYGYAGIPNYLLVSYSGVPSPYSNYYIYLWTDNGLSVTEQWYTITNSSGSVMVPMPLNSSGSPNNIVSGTGGGRITCYIVNRLYQRLASVTSALAWWGDVGSANIQYYP